MNLQHLMHPWPHFPTCGLRSPSPSCLLQNTMKARFLARPVADWPSAACNTVEFLHSFNSQMLAETLGTFLGKV